MKVQGRHLVLLASFGLILQGCTAPGHVRDQASRTLLPACLEIFNSQRYQHDSQGPISGTPVFSLAVSEDGKDQICNYATGGSLATTEEGRRVFALSQCERRRTAWIQRNQRPMNECRVFAIGNRIVY